MVDSRHVQADENHVLVHVVLGFALSVLVLIDRSLNFYRGCHQKN